MKKKQEVLIRSLLYGRYTEVKSLRRDNREIPSNVRTYRVCSDRFWWLISLHRGKKVERKDKRKREEEEEGGTIGCTEKMRAAREA